jgi:hypothetical protein
MVAMLGGTSVTNEWSASARTGLATVDAVLVYAVAIAVAVLVVPLTGGSFARLGHLRLRRVWLLFAGLGIQVALELVDLPRARFDDVGLTLLLLSYVFIIGFGLSNLLVTGMGVITVGIAMNAFVIALNQGMPYRIPEGQRAETTVKHRPEQPDDVLPALGDTIVLGDPVDASISFGDLVIAVGLVDLTYRASRRSRRSRGGRRDRSDGTDTPEPRDEITLEEPKVLDLREGLDAGVDARDALERVEHPGVVDVSRT